MKRLWSWWVDLWDAREPPQLLALIRIFVGAALLADFLNLLRIGAAGPLFTPPPDGFGTTDAMLWFWIGTAAAACIAVGLATRAACIVELVALIQLAGAAPDSDRGIHTVLRIVLVILALSQSHAKWSLDALILRKVGRPPPALVTAWPRRLLLLQLVWIYFSAGIQKGGDEWGPSGGFLALANAMTDPHLGRFDPGFVSAVLPLTRIGTAAVRAFEVTAPLYLVLLARADRRWPARARWLWIATGVAFHVGLVVLMPIGIFPWGMLALYPALLRPADSRYLQ